MHFVTMRNVVRDISRRESCCLVLGHCARVGRKAVPEIVDAVVGVIYRGSPLQRVTRCFHAWMGHHARKVPVTIRYSVDDVGEPICADGLSKMTSSPALPSANPKPSQFPAGNMSAISGSFLLGSMRNSRSGENPTVSAA